MIFLTINLIGNQKCSGLDLVKYFIKFAFKFLPRWKRQERSGMERRDLPFASLPSKCPEQPQLGQAEAGSEGLKLGLPCGWQALSQRSHHCGCLVSSVESKDSHLGMSTREPAPSRHCRPPFCRAFNGECKAKMLLESLGHQRKC